MDMPSVGEKRPAEDEPESPAKPASTEDSPAKPPPKKKAKVQLSYEDYTRYRALITTHLRSRATLDGVPGLKRSAVVDWYLKTHADEVGRGDRGACQIVEADSEAPAEGRPGDCGGARGQRAGAGGAPERRRGGRVGGVVGA